MCVSITVYARHFDTSPARCRRMAATTRLKNWGDTLLSFAFASFPCTFPCPAPLTSSSIPLPSTLPFSPISSIHLPYPLPFPCPPLHLFAALQGLGIAYAATASTAAKRIYVHFGMKGMHFYDFYLWVVGLRPYLFIYLFIVCQKSSMWQSHVSKYEAGHWD